MTAPRVRWEVRSAAGAESQWATYDGAAIYRDYRQKDHAVVWIVKVTTLPRRVTKRTWRRGDVTVEWTNDSYCLRVTLRGCDSWHEIHPSPDVRALALRLLDAYAPRKGFV